MKIIRYAFLVLGAILLTSPVYAADEIDDTTMAGAWLMTVPRVKDGIQQSMVFEVSSASLTGTVSTKAGSFEILEGRIDGDGISFTCNQEYSGVKSRHTFKIKRDDKRRMHVIQMVEGDPAFLDRVDYPAYKTEDGFAIGARRGGPPQGGASGPQPQ